MHILICIKVRCAWFTLSCFKSLNIRDTFVLLKCVCVHSGYSTLCRSYLQDKGGSAMKWGLQAE